MSVTEIRPAIKHFPYCDTMALGGAVQAHIETYGSETGFVSLSALVKSSENHRGRCDCAKLHLSRIENELRLAQKAAQHAGFSRWTVEVNRLTAERDAIRKAMS